MTWVSGASGFVGKYLTEYLGIKESPRFDITDYNQVQIMLELLKPTHIYHLAGQAFVPESIANPKKTLETNIMGTVNILEAVRVLKLDCKILLAGTGGDRLSTPYAVSKRAMREIGEVYAETYGMHIVTTRSYNHTGPGRGEEYAESAFAKQIVEIERGEREFLEHGSLEALKNYTDVRDMVKAYALAINLPPGSYDIYSPEFHTMQEVLDLLIKNAKVPIETAIADELFRPAEQPSATLSTKFQSLTGWQPTHTLEETMIDLLNYWRDK